MTIRRRRLRLFLIPIVCFFILLQLSTTLVKAEEQTEAYIKSVDIDNVVDGGGPWDPDDSQDGFDSSGTNKRVRSFDTLTYGVRILYGGALADLTIPANFKAVINGDITEIRYITSQDIGWLSDWRVSYQTESGEEVLYQTSDGLFITKSNTPTTINQYLNTDPDAFLCNPNNSPYRTKKIRKQVLTGQFSLITDNSSGTNVINVPLQVLAADNGTTFNPEFEVTLLGNPENRLPEGNGNENPYTNTRDSNSKVDPVTVTAAQSYNIRIESANRLVYPGYFSLLTGQEVTKEQYQDEGVVRGQLRGYGITLELITDGAINKGYKGIQLPKGPITFNINLKEFEEGNTDQRKDSDNKYVPILWDYKANNNTVDDIGYWKRQIKWNGSDYSKSAHWAAPWNNGVRKMDTDEGTDTNSISNYVYNGGIWNIPESYKVSSKTSENTGRSYPVTVNNFDFDFDNYYFADRDVGSSIYGDNRQNPFSSGYIEVLVQFPDEVPEDESTNFEITADNLKSNGQEIDESKLDDNKQTGTTYLYPKGDFTKWNSFTSVHSESYDTNLAWDYEYNHTEGFLGTNYWTIDNDAVTFGGETIMMWGCTQYSSGQTSGINAVNILQKFDSSMLTINPGYQDDKSEKIYDVSYKLITEKGLDASSNIIGNVKFLYAVDPQYPGGYDVNGLSSLENSRIAKGEEAARRMNDTVEADYKYYDSLESIPENEVCVAILMEVRNCKLIPGTTIAIVAPMLVTSDEVYTENTASTTNIARMWTNTQLPSSVTWKECTGDDPSYQPAGYVQSNLNKLNVNQNANPNYYDKAEHSLTGITGHLRGKQWGMSVLVLTYKARIKMGVENVVTNVSDLEAEGGKPNFNLTERDEEGNAKEVELKYTLKEISTEISRHSTNRDDEENRTADLTITVDIPTGVNLEDGISFVDNDNIDVTNSPVKVPFGTTKQITIRDKVSGESYTITVMAKKNGNEIVVEIKDAPLGLNLPNIEINAKIDENFVVNNSELEAVAHITGKGASQAATTNANNNDNAIIHISKIGKTSIAKQVHEDVIHPNEDINYSLSYNTDVEVTEGIWIYDFLPFEKDHEKIVERTNSSDYNGRITAKNVSVSRLPEDSYVEVFYSTMPPDEILATGVTDFDNIADENVGDLLRDNFVEKLNSINIVSAGTISAVNGSVQVDPTPFSLDDNDVTCLFFYVNTIPQNDGVIFEINTGTQDNLDEDWYRNSFTARRANVPNTNGVDSNTVETQVIDDTALTITKTVTGEADSEVTNSKEYSFQIRSEKNILNSNFYTLIKSDLAGLSESDINFSNNIVKVSLKGPGTLKIVGLPIGTYFVEEIVNDDINLEEFSLDVSYTPNDDGTVEIESEKDQKTVNVINDYRRWQPVKTETQINSEDTASDTEANHFPQVNVGDRVTYRVTWESPGFERGNIITVTDQLDRGVKFISASYDDVVLINENDDLTQEEIRSTGTKDYPIIISYNSKSHTVIWTLGGDEGKVPGGAHGDVFITVEVTEAGYDAWGYDDQPPYDGDSQVDPEVKDYQIINRASQTINNGETKYTDEVINPLPQEEVTDWRPVKTETQINGEDTSDTEDNHFPLVNIGDQVTYRITWKSPKSEQGNIITVTDQLDRGVKFVSASYEDVVLTNDNDDLAQEEISSNGTKDYPIAISYNSRTHTVVWTLGGDNEKVSGDTQGEVFVTVEVTEAGYNMWGYADQAPYEGDSQVNPEVKDYQITNRASQTVNNGETKYTDEVINPLPQEEIADWQPVKTETQINGEDTSSDTEDNHFPLVNIGDQVTYRITWKSPATEQGNIITVTDQLDRGVKFISASYSDVVLTNENDDLTQDLISNNGKEDYPIIISYNSATHTVIWTLGGDDEKVPGDTRGDVLVTVEVTEAGYGTWGYTDQPPHDGDSQVNSEIKDNQIINRASQTVNNGETKYTDEVINPLPQEKVEEWTPVKTETEPGDGKSVRTGDQITYTIDYYNYTDQPVTIIVVDPLDEGLDYVSELSTENGILVYGSDLEAYKDRLNTLGDVGYRYNSAVVWRFDDVEPGEKGTVTLVAQVNENYSADGDNLVRNQAYELIGDIWLQTNEVRNPVMSKEVSVQKYHRKSSDGDIPFHTNDNKLSQGEIVTYELIVTNNSDETVHDVILEDPTPGFMQILEDTIKVDKNETDQLGLEELKYTNTNGLLNWKLGDMDPNDQIIVVFDAKVNEVKETTWWINHAYIFCDELKNPGEKTIEEDSDEFVMDSTLFSMRKVLADDINGPSDLQNRTDHDEHYGAGIPSNVKKENIIHSITPETAQSSFYRHTADVREYVVPESVDIPTPTPTPTPSPTVKNPSLVKEQAVNNGTKTTEQLTVISGDILTYYLTVKNTTNAVMTNVVISDTIPKNLVWIEGNASKGFSYDYKTNTISWKIAQIGIGNSVTVSFNVKVGGTENTQTYINQFNMTYDQNQTGKPYPSNEVESVQNPPEETTSPKLIIEKLQKVTRHNSENYAEPTDGEITSDYIEVREGDIITYYIKVTNTGNAVANNVIIKDPVPSGLIYIQNSASNASVLTQTGNTLVWNISSLQPGQSSQVQVQFQVRVPEINVERYWRNIAFVSSDENNNQIPSNAVVIGDPPATPNTDPNNSTNNTDSNSNEEPETTVSPSDPTVTTKTYYTSTVTPTGASPKTGVTGGISIFVITGIGASITLLNQRKSEKRKQGHQKEDDK